MPSGSGPTSPTPSVDGSRKNSIDSIDLNDKTGTGLCRNVSSIIYLLCVFASGFLVERLWR